MADHWNELSVTQQQRATTVYNRLISLIPNAVGVSAIMGNIWIESAGTFDGRIVQGQNEDTLRTFCTTYTNNVDNGTITRNQFIHDTTGGGGYGLCQWTWYERKDLLYQFHLDQATSIGDTLLQCDFINYEMGTNYPATYADVFTATEADLYNVTKKVCTSYESPADQSLSAIQRRYERASTIYTHLGGGGPVPPAPGNIPFLLLMVKSLENNNE